MKTKSLSGVNFLVVGFALFTFGLLAILHEQTVFNLLSQVLPSAQAVEILGVVLQFLSEGLLFYGVAKSVSSRVLTSVQAERQMTVAGFTQSIQQLQSKLQADRQALITAYNQTVTKLDTLIANQRIVTVSSLSTLPASCKFCGSQIDQGHFCPKCGKAN